MLSHFRGQDFYYKNFNKKTYIDYNGNGVVVVSYEIVVLDPLKTKHLTISLDVSDGKDCCEFPPFEKMCSDDLVPFADYKFSYSSKENIVEKVTEDYGVHSNAERKARKENKRCIDLKFKLRSNNLQKKWNISYIVYVQCT